MKTYIENNCTAYFNSKKSVFRIKALSELLEDQSSKPTSLEDVSLKTEIIKQKQEMIKCLQDELIKVSRMIRLQN
jgi:hypothetical protein